MARFLRLAVWLVFLPISSVPVFAQTGGDRRPDFTLGIEWRILNIDLDPGYFRPIENVPESLRQVPSHSDDKWIYGSGQVIRTIPFNSVEPGFFMNYVPSVSPEVTIRWLRFRSGINMSFPVAPRATRGDGGATREVNQHGLPIRGKGTSLVYYAVEAKRVNKPGWSHELDFDIGRNMILVAGYSRVNYKLVIDTGWDRWNSLESYKDYRISRDKIIKKYVGLGWELGRGKEKGGTGTIFVIAGRGQGLSIPDGMGRDIEIKYGNQWFAGLAFSLRSTFLKNK